MKRKLGINTECLGGHGISPADALEMAHRQGFEAFFTGTLEPTVVAELRRRGEEYGMDFEFIHAPFRGVNAMWRAGMEYLKIMDEMKGTIDLAAVNGVPTVICHVSSGWNAPGVCDIGLARFDELVLYARERGVTVAFENIRVVGNLAMLVDRYEGMDNVAFCLDVGHEHGYTKTVSWFDIFTTRVIGTHIHDNHGRALEDKTCNPDEHLLPFDGTCRYEPLIRKMDQYGYTGSLMLEVFDSVHPDYLAMTPEAYIQTCYERIKTISEM